MDGAAQVCPPHRTFLVPIMTIMMSYWWGRERRVNVLTAEIFEILAAGLRRSASKQAAARPPD